MLQHFQPQAVHELELHGLVDAHAFKHSVLSLDASERRCAGMRRVHVELLDEPI